MKIELTGHEEHRQSWTISGTNLAQKIYFHLKQSQRIHKKALSWKLPPQLLQLAYGSYLRRMKTICNAVNYSKIAACTFPVPVKTTFQSALHYSSTGKPFVTLYFAVCDADRPAALSRIAEYSLLTCQRERNLNNNKQVQTYYISFQLVILFRGSALQYVCTFGLVYFHPLKIRFSLHVLFKVFPVLLQLLIFHVQFTRC